MKDRELLDSVIEEFGTIENYIRKTRKKRKDANKPRNKYNKSLPKEYKSYLSRANNKGLKFDLSIEEFYKIVNQNCVYCGTEGINGLDKIDPKGDYVKENVVSCCTKCNMMKFTYTQTEFIKHVNKIYAHQNQ
jgi:hypothetical protein